MDPLYEVTAEDAASGLLDRAFDAWFERILADPPEGVRRVLRRCLQKDPGSRLRDIGEARIVLEELLARTKRIGLRAAAPPVHARSIFVRRLERLQIEVE